MEGNVYVNGRPVCDDYWSQSDATVICKMLGFVGGTATVGSHFGPVISNYGMDDVLCVGSETDIADCPHATTHNCLGHEGAGVRCMQGRITSSTKSTQLALFSSTPWRSRGECFD